MKKYIAILFMVMAFSGVKAQTANESALEALGSLSAFSIYDAYCVIGIMADAYSDEVYESAYVIQIMDEQINMLNSFIDAMNKMTTSGFVTTEDDKTYITSSGECAALLIKEANALKTFINSPVTANSDAFQNVRTSAWTKISALLGL